MPTKACQDLVSQNDWCWWFHHFTLSVECQSLSWECTGINVLNFWTLQNKPSVQTQKVSPRIHSRMERSKISWSETLPALVSCGLLNQHVEYILSWDASFLKDLWVIWCHLMCQCAMDVSDKRLKRTRTFCVDRGSSRISALAHTKTTGKHLSDQETESKKNKKPKTF